MADLATLEKAAKEAADKVKACESDLTAKKNAAAAASKTLSQKESALRQAEVSRDYLQKEGVKPAGELVEVNRSKTATQKEKDAKKKAYDESQAKIEAQKKVCINLGLEKIAADKDLKAKEEAVKVAEKNLADAKQKSTDAEKAVTKQKNADAASKAAAAAVKKAWDAAVAAKNDPIGAAADAAKAALGGVDGLVQSGIEALANSKLLKGTKLGTALDLSNTLASVTGAWQDIGIDAISALATGIYQGNSVSQLYKTVVKAAKDSTKGNVDTIVDKAMAALKAYDIDFTKQDLSKMANDLKQYTWIKYAS